MFTGIVSAVGRIEAVEPRGDLRVRIACPQDWGDLDLGASVACSGVCLTVVDTGPGWFAVDVSAETQARTAAAAWREGGRLNLERALKLGDELGGHIVTGHVDGVGRVEAVEPIGDSLRLVVAAPNELAPLIAGKGSIALDGVSLTVNEVDGARFSVNVIPHTAAETNLGDVAPGRELHIEIDVIARYLQRMLDLRASAV